MLLGIWIGNGSEASQYLHADRKGRARNVFPIGEEPGRISFKNPESAMWYIST